MKFGLASAAAGPAVRPEGEPQRTLVDSLRIKSGHIRPTRRAFWGGCMAP